MPLAESSDGRPGTGQDDTGAREEENPIKAFRYEGAGGIDRLTFADLPVPVPAAGQVLIRNYAASLNYKDLFVARAIPPRDPSRPLIPVSDGAGEVAETGPAVDRVKSGDRVMRIVAQSWIRGYIMSLGRTHYGIVSCMLCAAASQTPCVLTTT